MSKPVYMTFPKYLSYVEFRFARDKIFRNPETGLMAAIYEAEYEEDLGRCRVFWRLVPKRETEIFYIVKGRSRRIKIRDVECLSQIAGTPAA